MKMMQKASKYVDYITQNDKTVFVIQQFQRKKKVTKQ